jgi:hypothetical protein
MSQRKKRKSDRLSSINIVHSLARVSMAYSLIFASYFLPKVVFNSSVLRIDFDSPLVMIHG